MNPATAPDEMVDVVVELGSHLAAREIASLKG